MRNFWEFQGTALHLFLGLTFHLSWRVMTLMSLVSATNDALIYKMRSTRKPHPNPHESILVLSAATSQSFQSTAIICGPMNRSTTRQRSLQSGDSITIPNTDAIVQMDSPVLYSVDAQTQIGSRDTVHHPYSESKSPSSVITIRTPFPSNERSQEFILLEEIRQTPPTHMSPSE